jgi:hypothetical protein
MATNGRVPPMHVISYAHLRDGVLYHGTLSDLDGVLKATWSYEKGGKKVSHDQPIDLPTFRSLWNRVNKLEVFKRNRVLDPVRPVHPVVDQVITIAFGDANNPQQAQFAIPADEADPQFLSWIKSLNIPNGSLKPDRPPEMPPKKPNESSPSTVNHERVYSKFFGKDYWVAQDDVTDSPPIDVYIFEPGEDGRGRQRDYYTLVTRGMSAERMRVPKGVEFRRAELLLYVSEPTDEQIGMLRFLARLPLIQERTWYHVGTTMTNGQPPQPIFSESELSCFLFLGPPIGRDGKVHEKLEVDSDPVTLLWVVPITKTEYQFILDQELQDFLELLDRKKHPFILKERRMSYVK